MNFAHAYVHVPFCARRCVYCDFSIAVRARIPMADYLAAIEHELKLRHAASRLHLETLYLGGGTPSKLGGEGVRRLIDLVRARAEVRNDAEVTIEANPEDVTPGVVREWRRGGVNRVSLGVQSFDDATLAWMHRTHDAESARRAIHVLREEGIDNVSLDLIFATPTGRSWTRDLDEAVALRLPHVSVYGLTVEERTPLGRWVARHDVSEAAEESFEQQFLEAHDRLTAAGYDHYEVSNYSLPGRHSRHNWAYWRRKPYVGLGPSAHEFDGVSRRWNADAYTHWLQRLGADADPIGGDERLDREQAEAEDVYLRLRTRDGLMLSPHDVGRARQWLSEGWASLKGDSTLVLTAPGWLRLDAIASDLTMLRSRY